MSGDEKLIRKVLEYVDRNTRVLHQGGGCRTIDGTLCIPAIAVDLSGGKWGPEADGLGEWVIAEKADNEDDVIHVIHPHDRARRLLRVDLDLGDDLTLADLRGWIDR
jgi:hypothetical protein